MSSQAMHNQELNMRIGIPIVVGIISICAFFVITGIVKSSSATKRMEETGARLRAKKETIDQMLRRIADCLNSDPGYTGSQFINVYTLLKELMEQIKSFEEERKKYGLDVQNARSALHGHRLAQNLFGGGANDLMALFYYRNDYKFIKALNRGSSGTIDQVTLSRAVAYVEYHKRTVAGRQAIQSSSKELVYYHPDGSGVSDHIIAAPESTPAKKKKLPLPSARFVIACLGVLFMAGVTSGKIVIPGYPEMAPLAASQQNAETKSSEEHSAVFHTIAETEAQTLTFVPLTEAAMKEAPSMTGTTLMTIPAGESCFGTVTENEGGSWMEVTYQVSPGYLLADETGTILTDHPYDLFYEDNGEIIMVSGTKAEAFHGLEEKGA